MFAMFTVVFLWVSQNMKEEPDARWLDAQVQIGMQDIARKFLGISALS